MQRAIRLLLQVQTVPQLAAVHACPTTQVAVVIPVAPEAPVVPPRLVALPPVAGVALPPVAELALPPRLTVPPVATVVPPPTPGAAPVLSVSLAAHPSGKPAIRAAVSKDLPNRFGASIPASCFYRSQLYRQCCKVPGELPVAGCKLYANKTTYCTGCRCSEASSCSAQQFD